MIGVLCLNVWFSATVVANELMYQYQSSGGDAMIIGPSGYITNPPNLIWVQAHETSARYELTGLVGFQAYDSSVLLHRFELNCSNQVYQAYRASRRTKEQRAIVSFAKYFQALTGFTAERIALCRPKNEDMIHWEKLFNFGNEPVRFNRVNRALYTVFESGLLVFYFEAEKPQKLLK